jgi:hypothetical protein
MIRLFGFLTGAGATIALMMLMIGPPELTAHNADADAAANAVSHSDFSAATTATATVESDLAAAPPSTVPARRAPPDEIGPPVTEQTAATSTPFDAVRQTDRALPGQTVPEPTRPRQAAPGPKSPDHTIAEAMIDPPADDASQWHSFWNPFRSEIAANGFASRLRSVTGIDYRVVRLEPGSYQVAFAYVDDAERRSKIAQIESATGLDLPEEAR